MARTYTTWAGHKVTMHGGGDDIDHIFATGIDSDSWRSSKPFYGMYHGHRIKELMRGNNTLSLVNTVHGNELRTVEDGWSAGSTNKYTYEGHTSVGYFGRNGSSDLSHFRCTAHKLTWRFDGITDTETRISRKP